MISRNASLLIAFYFGHTLGGLLALLITNDAESALAWLLGSGIGCLIVTLAVAVDVLILSRAR